MYHGDGNRKIIFHYIHDSAVILESEKCLCEIKSIDDIDDDGNIPCGFHFEKLRRECSEGRERPELSDQKYEIEGNCANYKICTTLISMRILFSAIFIIVLSINKMEKFLRIKIYVRHR